MPTPISKLIDVNLNMPSITFSYIGSVETTSDLWNRPKEPVIGEVCYVQTTGANYVWNGSTWNCLYDLEQPCYKRHEIEHLPITRKEYPDPTLDLRGVAHLIKCWFNYLFVRLGWNAQLA